MIPNTDSALRMISQRIMTQLLPDLKSTYSMSDGLMLGLLINAVADELAEGIQRRLDDIREMTVILQRSAGMLGESDKALVAGQTLSDFRLASVNERHDALTRVLIRLHAASEEAGHEIVCAEIWQYLRRHAERHQVTAVP